MPARAGRPPRRRTTDRFVRTRTAARETPRTPRRSTRSRRGCPPGPAPPADELRGRPRPTRDRQTAGAEALLAPAVGEAEDDEAGLPGGADHAVGARRHDHRFRCDTRDLLDAKRRSG